MPREIQHSGNPSPISNDKTFMYFFWGLYDALMSVLVENHIASSAYITLPWLSLFQMFWVPLPWKPQKTIPKQNARSYEGFQAIIEVMFLYLCLKNKYFIFPGHVGPVMQNAEECLQWRKSQCWKAKYAVVLYYIIVGGTGTDWHQCATLPQPTCKPMAPLTLLLFRDAWPGTRI